jgi:hypothetical protein
MALDLLSDDPAALIVVSLDPAHREQAVVQVRGDTFAEWSWAVTANEAGTWQLRLKVYAQLQGLNLPVKEVTAPTIVGTIADVTVRTDPWFELGRFVSGNWQWMVTTLLAAVGALTALAGLRARRTTTLERNPRSGPSIEDKSPGPGPTKGGKTRQRGRQSRAR